MVVLGCLAVLAWSLATVHVPAAAASTPQVVPDQYTPCHSWYFTVSQSWGYQGDVLTFKWTFYNTNSYEVELNYMDWTYGWAPTDVQTANPEEWLGAGGSYWVSTADVQVPLTATPGDTDLSMLVDLTDPDLTVHECSAQSATFYVDALLGCSFTGSPGSGTAPLQVSFTSRISGGDGSYQYSWSFGDGGTSTAPDPVYTYETAGSYTVDLVVTDGHGQQAAAQSSGSIVVSPASGGGGGGGGGSGGGSGGSGSGSGGTPSSSGGSSSGSLAGVAVAVVAVVVVAAVAAVLLIRGRRKPVPAPPVPYVLAPPPPPPTSPAPPPTPAPEVPSGQG